MTPWLRLIRLYYTLPFTLGLAVIAAYVHGGFAGLFTGRTAAGLAAVFCVLAGGYALNDCVDIDIDRVNNPGRVLPSGRISRRAALRFAAALFALGLAAGFGAGPFFFLVLLAVAAGMIAYNLYAKRLGILKDLLAAALAVGLYPLAFTLVTPGGGPRLQSLLFFSLWLFVTGVGYEMLKDARDLPGDCLAGPRPLFDLRPKRFYLPAARACVALGLVLALIPFLYGFCGRVYLAFYLAGVAVTAAGLFARPARVIPFIYAQAALITLGSFADLAAAAS